MPRCDSQSTPSPHTNSLCTLHSHLTLSRRHTQSSFPFTPTSLVESALIGSFLAMLTGLNKLVESSILDPPMCRLLRLPAVLLDGVAAYLPLFEGEMLMEKEMDTLRGNTCPTFLHFARTCSVVRSRIRQGHIAAWQHTSYRLFFTTPTLFVFKASDFSSRSQSQSLAQSTSQVSSGSTLQYPEHNSAGGADGQQYLLQSSWQAKSSFLDSLCSNNLRRHLAYLQRQQPDELERDDSGVQKREKRQRVMSVYTCLTKAALIDDLDWHGWLPREEPSNTIHTFVLPCMPHLSSLHITVDATTCPRLLSTTERCSSLFSLVPRLTTLSIRESSYHGSPDPVVHMKQALLLLPHLTTLYVLNVRLSLIDLVCIAAHPSLTSIRMVGICAVLAVGEQHVTNQARRTVEHDFPSEAECDDLAERYARRVLQCEQFCSAACMEADVTGGRTRADIYSHRLAFCDYVLRCSDDDGIFYGDPLRTVCRDTVELIQSSIVKRETTLANDTEPAESLTTETEWVDPAVLATLSYPILHHVRGDKAEAYLEYCARWHWEAVDRGEI